MKIKISICAIFILLFISRNVSGQTTDSIEFIFTKNKLLVQPGQVINIPVFVLNTSGLSISVKPKLTLPNSWSLVTPVFVQQIKTNQKVFFVFSIQVPVLQQIGEYPVEIRFFDNQEKEVGLFIKQVEIAELENIALQLVQAPENIMAGEKLLVSYLVENKGNTTKKLFLETNNCQVENGAFITLDPGESKAINLVNETSKDIFTARKVYYTLRVRSGSRIVQNSFRSFMVFPSQQNKNNSYLQFPVSASATYLTSTRNHINQQVRQFQIKGSGKLDTNGKHFLEFLARGPDNSDFNFLGIYDQYYLTYSNKNFETFVGEKSYSFTPLTESARYGIGTENIITLNNGLSLGFLYVVPRFFENIKNEVAVYSRFERNKDYSLGVFYVNKNYDFDNLTSQIGSIEAKFKAFEKTSVEIELSRGRYNNVWDNAFRSNLNSSFSIFRLSGNVFYTGKNYPGYFSNSTFYSGTFSAQPVKRLNVGVYTKQDYVNAQLDTFFVTAPYTNALQTYLSYIFESNSYLKIYWKEFERKDRLSAGNFHYKTRSLNGQFNQRFNQFDYSLLSEYGKTKNFRLNSENNEQTTYRASINMTYRFSDLHAIKVFSSWSNINSFVSNTQRKFTGGISVFSQLAKNLRLNLHVQNAFDIDDYYRNRNLMQLNIDYTFWKNHSLSVKSFYTLFREQLDNPEFALAATYTLKFGVPIKKTAETGNLEGRITNSRQEPVQGIVLHILNKTAITNKNGEYSFRGLTPGRHLLMVENSKFKINEITNIQVPAEVEIIPENTSAFDVKILEGARLNGQINLDVKANNDYEIIKRKLKNVLLEIKNEFELIRINPDENGTFSFPMFRPGNWTFKIYRNTLPEGLELQQFEYNLMFNSGEEQSLSFSLKEKERKIKFQNQNFTLTPGTPTSEKTNVANSTKGKDFYSVQIGAFSKKVPLTSKFFKGQKLIYEKQIDNYYKYFVGKYNTYEEAREAKEKMSTIFTHPFVVYFNNEINLNALNKQ